MNRILLTILAVCVSAAPARALAGETVPVQSLSIVPGANGAEVRIGVDSSVRISDFSLETPARVVIDIKGATLGVAARLYDRTPRAGVVNVRLAQYRPDIVRIVLELSGKQGYQLSRVDREIRVALDGGAATFAEWKLQQLDPAQLADRSTTDQAAAAQASEREDVVINPPPARKQQPKLLTITYENADIRDVIAAFAGFAGRTIIVGKDVSGSVTADVKNQPWDVALRAILRGQALALIEDSASGILTVESIASISVKQAAEPLAVRLIPVNYANAHSLAGTARSMLFKDCSMAQASAATTGAANSQAQCVVRGSAVADTTPRA
jgi:hypothetical protein